MEYSVSVRGGAHADACDSRSLHGPGTSTVLEKVERALEGKNGVVDFYT